jgi:hypothetical protein
MPDFTVVQGGRNAGLLPGGVGYVAITTGATPHVKTAWSDLVPALPFDARGLTLVVMGGSTPTSFLVDIGIGAAGQEQTIISNLIMGAGSDFSGQLRSIYLPIALPANTRLALRAQASGSNRVLRVSAIAHAGGFSSMPVLGRLTTYGGITGTSRGTQIDPGATANTKGAWTQITAATTNNAKLLCALVTFGGIANVPFTTWVLDIGIGAAGAETVLIADLPLHGGDVADAIYPPVQWFPVSVPVGTRLSARTRCEVTTAPPGGRAFDLQLMGAD